MRIPPGATFFHDRKVAMWQCHSVFFFPKIESLVWNNNKCFETFLSYFQTLWSFRKMICKKMYCIIHRVLQQTIEKSPEVRKKVFCYFCYCYVAMRLLGKCDELLGSIIHSMNHHHAHHLKKVSGLLLFIFLFLFSVAGKKKNGRRVFCIFKVALCSSHYVKNPIFVQKSRFWQKLVWIFGICKIQLTLICRM